MNEPISVEGRNGVSVEHHEYSGDGFRSYEVYQRERVGESTEKVNGAQLASSAYAEDPYPLLKILREDYPCYRDWINNCYWVTRYDDVTSLFTDAANFETRSRRFRYGLPNLGRDLNAEIPIQSAWAAAFDNGAQPLAEELLAPLEAGTMDLARSFAARYPLLLVARALQVDDNDLDTFCLHLWQLQAGAGWRGKERVQGLAAIDALERYFAAKLQQPVSDDNLLGALVAAGASAGDLVATLLEADLETLHGALANFWYLLLMHPDALQDVRRSRLNLKIACLESLRHAPAVISADRYALHEVERFGRLLPKGALVRLSALAANRDPRIFEAPDRFLHHRRDICHREARGQYRADGLPMGIVFGAGPPSRHPALPEDRSRSGYALLRDTMLTATECLLEKAPALKLAQDASPSLRSLRVGGLYTCWTLPVSIGG